MNEFKIGDKVIVNETIGGENEVCEVTEISQRCRLSDGAWRYSDQLELWNPKTDLEGGYEMKEFEIGKKYKTENRCDAQLLRVNAFGQFEGMLKYDGKPGVLTIWDKNGYCISGLDIKNEYKLVREVKMKEISMDKKYETKDGRTVELAVIKNSSVYGFLDGISMTKWSVYGKFHIDNQCESDLDLIEVNPYADFKVDDKVIVWDDGDFRRHKGYFAGVHESGKPMVWNYGATSWNAKEKKGFDNCVKWDGHNA
jgi:hypothetical protein